MAEPIKLNFPPGLVRGLQGDYAASGRYWDCFFMRWTQQGTLSVLQPIPAWDLAFDTAGMITGKARAAHAWLDNDEEPFALIGTSAGLFLLADELTTDITPVGFTGGGVEAGTWTADNFGEVGVACHDIDARLLEYQPGGGGLATAITNAPSAKAVFVTDEKFIVALCVGGDPRTYAWCDQANRTVWTATAINQAGDLPINEVGALMCGAKIRGGFLLWTTEGLHFNEYLGPPNVYGGELVSAGCGIISRNAKVTFGPDAYWMGDGTFYRYRGYVEPLPCDIADDVFGNINRDYQHKVWCYHNSKHGEIWWIYPRGDATECNYAAIYTYKGRPHWNHFAFPRLAGFDSSVFGFPVAISSEGRIMRHEIGWDYDETVFLMDDDGETFLTEDDGSALFTDDPGDSVPPATPYLISGPMEVGNGERMLDIDEFIPAEMNQGACDTYFRLRPSPNGTETLIGPYSSAARVGVLREARQVAIEYRPAAGTEDFRIGMWRVKAKPGGLY